MFTLHYSPGAVSMVSHFALEEAELPYRLERHVVQKGEHLTAEYRRIHPLARVPALELGDGRVLTETPALLWFIAEQVPAAALMPVAGEAVARANEWLSLFASGVHPIFFGFYRPERYTDDPAACAALRSDGRGRFTAMLEYVDSRLQDTPFVLGDRFSLVDANALVFILWARRLQLSVDHLTRYDGLARRVLQRPAVQRALAQEGLSA